MRKWRILDLFCGAGGASMGYSRIGFEVVGVDNKRQRHYPFEFIQGDALEQLDKIGHKFDAIHASPPCQAYSAIRGLVKSRGHDRRRPDLVAAVREKLKSTSIFWVLENVNGAPLINPICLCGSAFGLNVKRHRYFECSFWSLSPGCYHHVFKKDKPRLHTKQGRSFVVGCYGKGRGVGDTVQLWRDAMGIDWMNRRELSQAIPPAYTEYLGKILMYQLKRWATHGRIQDRALGRTVRSE